MYGLTTLLLVSLLHTSVLAQTSAGTSLPQPLSQPKSSTRVTEPDPVAVKPPPDKVPENLVLAGTGEVNPKHIFIADKSQRTLTVWGQNKDLPVLIGAYPMDIGKRKGDKSYSGDHRTPEGIYFFQDRLEGQTLDYELYGRRAFTLDYPNLFDMFAGKTGSGIWLHAVPDTTSLLRGSRGCVVVRNETIEELSSFIRLKSTPMLILDQVNYVTAQELTDSRRKLQNWVENWRTAWEQKDVQTYMSFYSDNFKAMRMSKNKWRRYKESLNEKYSKIKVTLKDPFLVTKKDEAIISFVQDYESDGLKDFGEKTLYVKRKNGDPSQFEILTEIWRPLNREFLAHKQGP